MTTERKESPHETQGVQERVSRTRADLQRVMDEEVTPLVNRLWELSNRHNFGLLILADFVNGDGESCIKCSQNVDSDRDGPNFLDTARAFRSIVEQG